jgi:hypothetical protein
MELRLFVVPALLVPLLALGMVGDPSNGIGTTVALFSAPISGAVFFVIALAGAVLGLLIAKRQ